MSNARSPADIWRDNPPWAKVLLVVALGIFALEALGVVNDLGLAALNLTAIAFLFSMNGTLTALAHSNERIAAAVTEAE